MKNKDKNAKEINDYNYKIPMDLYVMGDIYRKSYTPIYKWDDKKLKEAIEKLSGKFCYTYPSSPKSKKKKIG